MVTKNIDDNKHTTNKDTQKNDNIKNFIYLVRYQYYIDGQGAEQDKDSTILNLLRSAIIYKVIIVDLRMFRIVESLSCTTASPFIQY